MEQKLKFKTVFIIAITLMLVSGISGALIVCLNHFTEPIIEENNKRIEQEKLAQIYQDATFTKVENVSGVDVLYEAHQNNELVGYVYKVSGKNAYGAISLLVGINPDGLIKRSVMLENTESFATEVNNHFASSYHEDMSLAEVDSVDVKCGATYGAKLVKELINQALNHFEANYKKEA